LLASLITWLAATAWRVSITWATAFSVLVHVYVAFTLATVGIASVAGALLPQSAEVDLRDPPFTDLTSLLGGTDSEVYHTLAGEIDVRSAYVLMLLWLGLRGSSREAPRTAIAGALLTIAFVRLAGVMAISLFR
jgi:hypothetical protein